MNEAIRTDETAKETSGKAGRLDTDKDTGREIPGPYSYRMSYILAKSDNSILINQ